MIFNLFLFNNINEYLSSIIMQLWSKFYLYDIQLKQLYDA